MRFETYIALRYMRGKRKSRLLGLITFIAVAGVAVGVMALVVVLSVVSGFEQAFRQVIIGNRPHISVEVPGSYFVTPEVVIELIEEAIPEVVAASPTSQVEALLRHPGRKDAQSPGFLLGIDPERENKVTALADNLTPTSGRTRAEGRLPGDGEIVLGYRLAEKLQAQIGDRIRVTSGDSRSASLTVVGLSEMRMIMFDEYFAYISLPTAATLTGRHGADAIQCRLEDPMAADQVARIIEDEFGVVAYAWQETHGEYFMMLEQNKGVLFTILVFIVLVASFNIASTLIMMVIEKRQDIGILRTIGVSGPAVLLIFVIEGLLIGALGTLIGLICGGVIALQIDPIAQGIAKMMGLGEFQTDIYNIDRLPAAINMHDITVIAVSAIILTLISTIYPAWSASKLDPVDALRRE